MSDTSEPIWATHGNTESGDDLPILLWRTMPTNEQVQAAYREMLPEEFEFVGFVNWSCTQAEFRD